MKKALAIISITCLFFIAQLYAFSKVNSGLITGTWLTGSGKGKVKIYQVGDVFEGKIVWLKEPLVNGKPDLDDLNPNKELKSRQILGIKVLNNLKFNSSENKWEGGTIYDPENGKTYSCNITAVDEKKIHLRGYVGISLLGRTDTWFRVRDIE